MDELQNQNSHELIHCRYDNNNNNNNNRLTEYLNLNNRVEDPLSKRSYKGKYVRYLL